MKKILLSAMVLGAVPLASCGGQGDDKLAERVEESAEKSADAIEQKADELEKQADALYDKAENVEEAGEARAEAIDGADVNADAMTAEKKQAIVDGEAPAVR